MKFLKKNKTNLIFVLILVVIVFTPLGFNIKVFFHKYINFNPSEIVLEKQVQLNNYNWNLTNLEGSNVDFNNYKGKLVVINFWATWCPPCVAEMASLQKLYDTYGNEVEFLFVANDKLKKVNSFMEDNNYNFPVQFETSSTLPELVSSSIPTTYIIDKTGNIVLKKKGAANWNSDFIHTILNKHK